MSLYGGRLLPPPSISRIRGGWVPPRRGKSSDIWARAAFYAGLGFIIPASAVGGYFIGRFLDLHLHTSSLLAVIGAFAGTAAGIVEVIQLVMRMEKNASQKGSSTEDGRD